MYHLIPVIINVQQQKMKRINYFDVNHVDLNYKIIQNFSQY